MAKHRAKDAAGPGAAGLGTVGLGAPTRRTVLAGGAALAAGVAAAGRRARAEGNGSPVIRIGVLGDQSSIYRDLSGPVAIECVRQGIEDAGLKDINVQMISGDHQGKPDIGASLARQWIDRDGVDMICDVPNSAVALAVAGVCREKDRAFIDSGAGTTDLTGSQCAATTVHMSYDTWMLSHSTGAALVKQGGTSWFFITADYAFGQALERDASSFVKQAGGTVVGSVHAPIATSDFSSYLLQAQSSGAKVVALANAGTDTTNAIKQAAEFGLRQNGTVLAGLLIFITDVHALGLPVAQGLVLTASFYWDLNERTRALSKRLEKRIGPDKRIGMGQAGCYAGTIAYLKAVQAMGVEAARKSGTAVVDKMKSMPTDDDAFGPGSIRKDGVAVHPAYLFQVKTPAESKGPWDYYKLLRTTPADEAFQPMAQGGCKLVSG